MSLFFPQDNTPSRSDFLPPAPLKDLMKMCYIPVVSICRCMLHSLVTLLFGVCPFCATSMINSFVDFVAPLPVDGC